MNAYICELPKKKRKKALKRLLKELEGWLPADELKPAIEAGMNSRVCDLSDTIDVSDLI